VARQSVQKGTAASAYRVLNGEARVVLGSALLGSDIRMRPTAALWAFRPIRGNCLDAMKVALNQAQTAGQFLKPVVLWSLVPQMRRHGHE
jgi:hypothetical protein